MFSAISPVGALSPSACSPGAVSPLLLAIRRAILDFNGTQYIELDNKITITGECEIEWYSQWPESAYIFANASVDTTDINSDRLAFLDGIIYGAGFNQSSSTGTPLSFTPSAEELHRFKYTRSADGFVKLLCDGVVLASGGTAYTGPIYIDSFLSGLRSNTSVPLSDGVIFDLSVKQGGVLTNFWAIDDNSGTIYDSVGGNNGTLINYIPGDWETITRRIGDDFWLGTENLISDDKFIQLGGFTQIGPNTWGKYGETSASIKWDSKLKEGYRYQFKGETLWRDPSSPYGANMSANFAGNNSNVREVQEYLFTRAAGSSNQQEFRINIESSGKMEIRTDYLKRYLQYAEGALVEPEEPVDSFGTFPMEIDSELTSLFSMVGGGSPATDVVLEPTTATITNPNEGSTVLSAIRSTVVSTAPVYFELDVEAPDGHTEEEIQFSPTVNLDGDNQVAVLLGGVSSVEAGESVELALGNNGISANLYRASPSIVSYPFASGETSASVGVVRLGIAYDPSAGTYTIYAWTTGGATFQYPTASDVSTVVEFGPYNLHPQETANHFSTTTAVGVPDTVVGGVVYRIVTDEADFSNPEGKPAGYVDLASAAGGDTAPHTLPFLANSPF